MRLLLTYLCAGCAAGVLAAPFRTCHFGNSQTDVIRNVLPSLALQAGHTNYVLASRTNPGVPLTFFTQAANRPASEALLTQGWDAVVFEIYSTASSEPLAAIDLSGMAYAGNSNCQVYLYVIWPYGNADWNNPPLMCTEAFSEGICTQVAAAYPGKPAPLVVPASLVMRELGALADRGELPNVMSHFQLLADGTHPSKYGSYAVNCTTLSQLYRECPTNYPALVYALTWDGKLNTNSIQYTIPGDTAAIIKNVVWDVVRSYPKSGVDQGLAILGRVLPVGIVNRLYTNTLAATHADGAVHWAIAPGDSMPAGLSLADSGLISGVVASAGIYLFTVQATDTSHSAARRFSLTVSADVAPQIATASLDPLPLDEYRFQSLSALGGVGRLTWRVSAGRLPLNMTLAESGALYGTPGEAGTCAFSVRVQDSHPDGPRAATNVYAWQIGPASNTTLFVKKTIGSYTIDGLFNEPCWEAWERISKPVLGACTKTASFAAVWYEQESGRGTLLLGVKVRDGGRGAAPTDAVDIFIDALHNRELVYNSDDLRVKILRNSTGTLPLFWSYKVLEVPGGFDLELAINDLAFYGQPATAYAEYGGLAAGTVYGFDLAVTEGATNQIVWRGTADNAVNTAGFGSMRLTDCAAGAPPYQPAGPAMLFSDGEFAALLRVKPFFQTETSKAGTWYTWSSYYPASAIVSGPDGNPGRYVKLSSPEGRAFVCLPAPASTDTWTIAFDRRQVAQYNLSTLSLYGCRELDIPGSNVLFNTKTPFKTFTLTNSATWLRHGFTATIPGGYDLIALVWYVNTGDTNAGIDNVVVTQMQRPPVFTNQPIVKPPATANALYYGTIADCATDPNVAEALQFSKMAGPAWLAVATNGALSGVPGTSDIGATQFVVRVTDAIGSWDEATLLMNVIAPEPVAALLALVPLALWQRGRAANAPCADMRN